MPYLSAIEYLKEVKHSEAGVKKTPFKNNLIRSPFFVYLKINGVENSGTAYIKFYQKKFLFTPVLISQIWTLFSKFSDFPVNTFPDRSSFPNILLFYPEKASGLETLGFPLFRQYFEGFFFTISSILFSPHVINLNHFFYSIHKLHKELTFKYGEQGKYYEHIIFIDKVSGFLPGQYRYAVFLNNNLTYEGYLVLFRKKDKK